ncbi:MAG: hypothetical protein OSB62_04695 [Alphaproteobacteria bacterium]|nr:hypothetical protein [Alphaproteobacteria bacterium]
MQTNKNIGTRAMGAFWSHMQLISTCWVLMLPSLALVAFMGVYMGVLGFFAVYICVSMSAWAFVRARTYNKKLKKMRRGTNDYRQYNYLSGNYFFAVIFFLIAAIVAWVLAEEGISLWAPWSAVGFVLFTAWTVLPPETPRDSLLARFRKWIKSQDESWNAPAGD